MHLTRTPLTIRNRWNRFASGLALVLLFLVASRAEQLPVRSWSTSDGLPQNHIDRIRRDSRGYLWICTGEGLARFDGYGFVNYTKAHGLPTTVTNDFLETKRGEYWVATDEGLCLFDPRGKAVPFQPGQSPPMPRWRSAILPTSPDDGSPRSAGRHLRSRHVDSIPPLRGGSIRWRRREAP